MKKHKGWSYAPYKPVFDDIGDIYITRLVPSSASIYFEWLPMAENTEYEIFCRVRGEGEFKKAGSTKETSFTIENLEAELDFEFYVVSQSKKSLVRLARTGDAVGAVVNYLHPDDKAYSFSGQYLCSPSMVRHPEGHLLSSMDLFDYDARQCLTLIFRSDDDGKSWYYVCELYPCFWGKMFIHKGEVYMLACSTEFGDLLIGKSSDGGSTWTEPTVLLRGCPSPKFTSGVHKNPQPVVEFGGRLWATLEWAFAPSGVHAPMVMSAPVDSDLTNADSWSYSEPIDYDPAWEGVAKGKTDGNIEGSLTVIDGKLFNIMRYGIGPANTPQYGLIMAFEVDTENPEAPLKFSRVIKFPGNRSKFTIKYDEISKKYFSFATRITQPEISARNLLTLMVSDNATDWCVLKDIYDYRHLDAQAAGFQYVDFEFEGDDIIFICRTALNNPHGFHDSNYQTFDRVKNFRKLAEDAGELEIFDI